MGLDCYMVHASDQKKAFTSEDDQRLADIQLCAGLFSGDGSDGSFRGKYYEPLIDHLCGGEYVWHKESKDPTIMPIVRNDELADQAKGLRDLLEASQEVAEQNEEILQDDTIIIQVEQRGSIIEYTYKEVRDLEILLRATVEGGGVMQVWW
tara:strand:- start:745 stop:1197 length:453 start_codon:yes stop_codon:yes gene_type:complete